MLAIIYLKHRAKGTVLAKYQQRRGGVRDASAGSARNFKRVAVGGMGLPANEHMACAVEERTFIFLNY